MPREATPTPQLPVDGIHTALVRVGTFSGGTGLGLGVISFMAMGKVPGQFTTFGEEIGVALLTVGGLSLGTSFLRDKMRAGSFYRNQYGSLAQTYDAELDRHEGEMGSLAASNASEVRRLRHRITDLGHERDLIAAEHKGYQGHTRDVQPAAGNGNGHSENGNGNGSH